MFDLDILIIGAGVVFAALISGRISHVMAKRQGIGIPKRDAGYFAIAFGAVIAGVLAGFAVTAAVEMLGLAAGIVADVLLLPGIGAIWIFIVGGNRALERIITNLLNKLDTKASS